MTEKPSKLAEVRAKKESHAKTGRHIFRGSRQAISADRCRFHGTGRIVKEPEAMGAIHIKLEGGETESLLKRSQPRPLVMS